MKRSFERRDGVLADEWTEPDGRKCRGMAAACHYGEGPDEEQRGRLLGDLGSGSATEGLSIYALSCDPSEETLEGLLKSLGSLNMAAPMALTRFLDDPRVQPALLEAARRVPAEDLANFAQVLGLVGGEGAREVLRSRMSGLREDPRTGERADFHNRSAGSLEAVAEAILRLEGDAEDAAAALVDLLEHPTELNKLSTARVIAECLSHDPCLQVRDLFREGLGRCLVGEDDEVFLAAGPGLMMIDHAATLERLGTLLRNESEVKRSGAVGVLGQAPHYLAGRCLEMVREAFETEPSVRLGVRMASRLGRLAPPGRVSEVARRALANESPTLRQSAVGLLRHLPSEEARLLAEEALADEPDPLLKKWLVRHVQVDKSQG